MNATSGTKKSLLDDVVVDLNPKGTTTKASDKAERKSTRRKSKPYEQLRTAGQIDAARKAEKASTRGQDPLSSAAARKRAKETAPKLKPVTKLAPGSKAPKAPKIVKVEKASKKAPKDKAATSKNGSATCTFCGKPLSRHTSVANGMGDVCAAKQKLLPAGMTLQDHYLTMTVLDQPDPKNYMPIKEAFVAASKKGISNYRMIIAYGGDRMLRPPLNEHFKLVIYKGRKYIPKSFLQNLDVLKG